MSDFTNLRAHLLAILKALAVSIPAGYLFHRLRTPIPWGSRVVGVVPEC